MLGAITGDVLGSIYEHQSTRDKNFNLFHFMDRPTDDSVLTLAIARAITDAPGDPGEDDYGRSLREFGNRYPNAGYGASFHEWLEDPTKGEYNSWGNGSAMRCSAVGWAWDTEEVVLEQARLTAAPTHGHPEGIKGAQAVALSVMLARRGASKDEIRATVGNRFDYDLNRTINEIRPHYEFQVSCMRSVPEAIIAFLDSCDVEDAIRNAISLGGDADTQGCMAGAIAEAFYGEVPPHLLAFGLPRLDDFLLETAHDFLKRHGSPQALNSVECERVARDGGQRRAYIPASADGPSEPAHRIIMHGRTWTSVVNLASRVQAAPERAGTYLTRELERLPVPRPDAHWFLVALLNTKQPRIFAESEVLGDGSDWTSRELSLLGDISIAVPVTVFDNGLHHAPTVHDLPFQATLLYVPGALLRHGSGGTPADWKVVRMGRVSQARYDRLYERRLLPLLRYASTTAMSRGTKAFITIPGLGCGQFAGRFGGTLGVRLQAALRSILTRHAATLPGIRAVWYDPYSECRNERHEIEHISFLVRPLRRNDPQMPQLCMPETYEEPGDDFSRCELFSMVAWDHVSWPGNDFWAGARATDDGVKAAATDSMFAMTGVRGKYNEVTNTYDPPAGFVTWEDVVSRNELQIRAVDNVVVVDPGSGGSDLKPLEELG